MQITTFFRDDYQASQVRVRMVKTFVVNVYLDVRWHQGREMSEEELEEMAHEYWLEIQASLLARAAQFSCIDIEFVSTDHVAIEVVE